MATVTEERVEIAGPAGPIHAVVARPRGARPGGPVVVAWSDIRGISMPAGAPWPTLVHGDDERTMLFALQRSDGPRAAKAIDELVRRIP